MRRSDSIDKLTIALAKAQAVMEGAAKDSNNPFFHSKYADLASCWAAWRPAGPPNGLALMQFATAIEERLDPPIEVQADGDRKAKTIHFIQRVSVETLLSFEDQWVSETLTVLVKDDSPQSTILGETYCRRGGMSAVIGIAPEDDDGDAAANHGADAGERRTERRAPKPACPKCNKPDFVYEDRQKGGWFCWKAKGGCGHNWLPEAEFPPAEEPFGNPPEDPKAKAKKVAKEHGMTTGEELALQAAVRTLDNELAKPYVQDEQKKLRTYLYDQASTLKSVRFGVYLSKFWLRVIENTAAEDHERWEAIEKLASTDREHMTEPDYLRLGVEIDKKRRLVAAG